MYLLVHQLMANFGKAKISLLLTGGQGLNTETSFSSKNS